MAKIKAIKYLGWKFLRIPHTESEDEALSWPGGFEGAGGDGAVKSVNGKTGSVEITAEDIPVGTDSTVALALESKVSKVGDTMTGQLYIETISRLDTVYSSAIALLPHKIISKPIWKAIYNFILPALMTSRLKMFAVCVVNCGALAGYS